MIYTEESGSRPAGDFAPFGRAPCAPSPHETISLLAGVTLTPLDEMGRQVPTISRVPFLIVKPPNFTPNAQIYRDFPDPAAPRDLGESWTLPLERPSMSPPWLLCRAANTEVNWFGQKSELTRVIATGAAKPYDDIMSVGDEVETNLR